MLKTLRRSTTALLVATSVALLVAAAAAGVVIAAKAKTGSHANRHHGKAAHPRSGRRHARTTRRSRARRPATHRATRTPVAPSVRTAPPRPAPVPPPPAPAGTGASGQGSGVLDAAALVGPNDVVAPLPASTHLFAPTSFWNAPLGQSPALDPNSGTLVASINAEVQREIAGRFGPWINTNQWSVPVYTVGSAVPRIRVKLDATVAQLQRDFDSVPMPANAQPAGGGDQSMTVYQPSTDTLWEFWLAARQADGWHARWGGKMTGVSSNPGWFANGFGATATSLPLLGGLITINELRRGQIDHALALALPNTTANAFTWPAQRGDGKTLGPGTIPEGTRFRIDPSLDLSRLGLTPTGLAIARAAQRYGIVVRDTSGTLTFFAEDPVATGGDPYGPIWHGAYPSQLLSGFPWRSLQVVAPRAG